MGILDRIHRVTRWRVRKFETEKLHEKNIPYDDHWFEGNVLLNEGINELTSLIGGVGGVKWDSANARLGVGNSSAPEDPTHVDLQGASKTYVLVDSVAYGTNQKITWVATFIAGVGNHAWQEFTVSNAADGAGDNLNRHIEDEGTKMAGQVWELTLEITFS